MRETTNHIIFASWFTGRSTIIAWPHPTFGIADDSFRLWGNPQHLAFVAGELRRENPDPHLHLLVAKSNSGNFTYDGIELGGERLTREIEDEIESLANAGTPVSRFSLVGYSLGGLVARYAIGLLYSKRVFDQIEPMVRSDPIQSPAGAGPRQDFASVNG